MLKTNSLIELIGMPLKDIAEASSCLWFVKSTEQQVIQSIVNPMFEHYQILFRETCRNIA